MSDESYMRMALELATRGRSRRRSPGGRSAGFGRIRLSAADATLPSNAAIPRRTPKSWRCAKPAASAGNYRLEGARLYTTLEPCVMCAGALVAARIATLVFGARDLRFGGVRSKFRLADAEVLNHRLMWRKACSARNAPS